MEIPWQSLDKQVLDRLIEEIVTRDGTDYGVMEKSREEKILEVRRALESNRAVLHWDIDSESASIRKVI